MSEKLSPKQTRAIMTLLQEDSIASVARTIGVSEGSIYNWLKDPLFSTEYKRAKDKAVDVAIGKIQHATSTAVDTILEIAENGKTETAKLNAAKTIIEFSIKIRNNDVAERIEDLEERLNNSESEVKYFA